MLRSHEGNILIPKAKEKEKVTPNMPTLEEWMIQCYCEIIYDRKAVRSSKEHNTVGNHIITRQKQTSEDIFNMLILHSNTKLQREIHDMLERMEVQVGCLLYVLDARRRRHTFQLCSTVDLIAAQHCTTINGDQFKSRSGTGT